MLLHIKNPQMLSSCGDITPDQTAVDDRTGQPKSHSTRSLIRPLRRCTMLPRWQLVMLRVALGHVVTGGGGSCCYGWQWVMLPVAVGHVVTGGNA